MAVIFFQPIIDQVLYHISNRCALFCTRSFEADMYPRPPFEYQRGQFGYRKLLYYKDFPGMSKPVFMVSVCSSVKIKGRDCGTINGHDESSSIRALMKDAREVLVR